MPIDPRIAMSFQQPEMLDPFQAQAKAMAIKNAMQQNQINQQQIEMQTQQMNQIKQKMDVENKIQSVLDQYEGDVEKATPVLIAKFGNMAMPFIKEYSEYKKQLALTNNEQDKAIREKVTFYRDNIGKIFQLPEEDRNRAYQEMMGTMIKTGQVPQDIMEGGGVPFMWDDQIFSWTDKKLERLQTEVDLKNKNLDTEIKKNALDSGTKSSVEQQEMDDWLKKNPGKGASDYLVWKLGINRKLGGDSKETLQEELKRLVAKEKLGSLSAEEKANKDAIEYSLGFVANQYGAGYKQFTDSTGQTFLVHPDGRITKVEKGLRPQLTATEREELSTMDEMITKLDKLEKIAKRNTGSVGFGQGSLASWKSKTVGSSTDVNEIFRIADGVADDLLRAKSGAQINEQEYARLKNLVPDPRFNEDRFFDNLNNFRAEWIRVLNRRSGGAPIVTPRSSTTTVKMKTPDGQSWDVPANQVDAAKARGAVEVK